MQFKNIIGHNNLKKKLIGSVKDNRVSHAQLFYGQEGSGKLALAIAYAQYLSCTDKKEDDSCGCCASCVKYDKLIHPDLHFFFPNAVTPKNPKPYSKLFITEWRNYLLDNNYYVALEDWHSFLGIENKQAIINVLDCNEINRILSLRSFESDYTVIIIYMVEKLYHKAAPKLLKILEEPPEKTLFILISENHVQILKTILSRTQLIKIPKHKDADIINALVARNKLSHEQASKIANIAEGNMCEALRIVEDDYNSFNFNNFKNWMRVCWKIDYQGIIKWTDEMAGSNVGREKLKHFFLYAQKMARACILKNLNADNIIKVTPEEIEFLNNFAPFINNKNIQQIFDEFINAYEHIGRNINAKIVLIDVSFKIMRLLKT